MKNGIPFSILVVDDDEDDRIIMDEAFQHIGYEAEVKKFIDGKALLHYLEQIDPSLYPSVIVLDNTLPGLGAGDLLAILKTHPLYKPIPVVVYTTSVSPTQKQRLLSSGAYACLEKAASMQEIIKIAEDLKQLAQSNINES